jgi:cysteine synthase B
MKYPTIEDSIGKTPLVRLQRIGADDSATRGNVILGKLEGNNPAGSVKDRPALSMIRRAQERGDIKPLPATPVLRWPWPLPSRATA